MSNLCSFGDISGNRSDFTAKKHCSLSEIPNLPFSQEDLNLNHTTVHHILIDGFEMRKIYANILLDHRIIGN